MDPVAEISQVTSDSARLRTRRPLTTAGVFLHPHGTVPCRARGCVTVVRSPSASSTSPSSASPSQLTPPPWRASQLPLAEGGRFHGLRSHQGSARRADLCGHCRSTLQPAKELPDEDDRQHSGTDVQAIAEHDLAQCLASLARGGRLLQGLGGIVVCVRRDEDGQPPCREQRMSATTLRFRPAGGPQVVEPQKNRSPVPRRAPCVPAPRARDEDPQRVTVTEPGGPRSVFHQVNPRPHTRSSKLGRPSMRPAPGLAFPSVRRPMEVPCARHRFPAAERAGPRWRSGVRVGAKPPGFGTGMEEATGLLRSGGRTARRAARRLEITGRRAPPVPVRPGNSGEPRSLADRGHEHGP